MAIDIPDVRRRVSRMRAPDISTDDLAPAVDRAGRTLRDWRKSTEAALASLGDISLDSLPQVSLDSLPGLDSLSGRKRPSPVRQNGPVIAVALLGVLAGLIIGWWMGSATRLGSAASMRSGGWRSRAGTADNRDAANRSERGQADAGWSIGQRSADQPAASGQPVGLDSSDTMDRHVEGREPGSSADAWRGVGPGRSAEPLATPEFASRTVRND
jgi:hypothetical protein